MKVTTENIIAAFLAVLSVVQFLYGLALSRRNVQLQEQQKKDLEKRESTTGQLDYDTKLRHDLLEKNSRDTDHIERLITLNADLKAQNSILQDDLIRCEERCEDDEARYLEMDFNYRQQQQQIIGLLEVGRDYIPGFAEQLRYIKTERAAVAAERENHEL